MRFAVVSGFGCSLSWLCRLQDEGHEVKVWIDGSDLKLIGDGMVPKAGTWMELVLWVRSTPRGTPCVMLFDASGMGEKADIARKAGILVVGGGEFPDRLEKDREFGFDLARAVGCRLPRYKTFSTVSAATEFAKKMPYAKGYFKTDKYLDSDATHGGDSKELSEYLPYVGRTYGDRNPCMIQEGLEGVALSTARWWNGRAWIGPMEGTIEHKKMGNDETGPSTGCAFNAVWYYMREPRIARELGWSGLDSLFRKYNAPPGLYDINAIVNKEDNSAYFLEWTPRLGYDSEMTSSRLLQTGLGEFLYRVASGSGAEPAFSPEIAYSIRLTIPPYPWEHSHRGDKKTAVGTPVNGADGTWAGTFVPYQLRKRGDDFDVAAPEGIVGLALTTGDNLAEMHGRAVSYVKDKLRVPGLQYRTDGAKVISDDAAELQDLGYEVHPGLIIDDEESD